MPKLAPNALASEKAINGLPGTYTIKGRQSLELYVGTKGASWRIQYRMSPLAPQKRFTFNNNATAENYSDAKLRAAELLVGVSKGIDPQAERQAAIAAATASVRTVEIVYREWLDNPRRERELSPRSRAGFESVYALHIKESIGNKSLASIDVATCKKLLDNVCKATTNAKRGWRGTQANQVHKIMRAMCEYAAREEYVPLNVMTRIDQPVPSKNPKGKQSRPLRDDELRLVWRQAPSMMAASYARLMKLAILLGKRISELVNATKSEVVLDTGDPTWFIPGSREGNKARQDQIVPLPPLAVANFREQIEASTSKFIFPADGDDSRPVARHPPSIAFGRMRYTLAINGRVRFHDARGLIIDQMAKLGVPSEFRSHVLHRTGDMRATRADKEYSTYDFADDKRRALRLWEARLLEIVEGRKPSGLKWLLNEPKDAPSRPLPLSRAQNG